MPLLRRKTRDEDIPKAGPYAAGWDVPARFNFTRDVVEAIATDPLKSAMTFVDREGIVDRRTFHEIAGDAARWAHLMRTRLDRGDRVVLAIGNVPAWHTAMLGAIKSGLVAVPCPRDLRARDLAFRVRDSGARLVVADRSLELEVEEMRHQVGASVSVVFLDEALDELRRYMPVAPTEDTTAGETALILYTSGTDQEPKGVVHTHAFTWAQRAQATHWLDVHEGDVVWCTSEPGWAKGIWNSLLGPWSHGAEIVVHDGPFDAQERLSLVQRLGVTILAQTPTEYRMLAKLEKLEFTHLPRLRHAVSAGEPLNPEVIARFQDALGLTVHDGYGQTENCLLIANTPGVPIRPGSMGLPTPGHDVAVIDEFGQVCPPGVEGDLALIGRPPTLFAGYWEAPERTDAVFRDDWYLTGDRATRDADGYFWFAGRADDVIISAGYRISPFEVESALLEHPAVAESAVVGVPDIDRGQIVKAFVVLRPGQEPADRLATELQDHVTAVTAPYNCPREVAFLDELPKTASGKVQRSALRRLHTELASAPPALSIVPDPDAPDPTAVEAAEQERREAELAARREAVERTRLAAAAAAERAALQTQDRVRAVPEPDERAVDEGAAAAAVATAAAAAAAAAAAEQARLEAEERARIEAEDRARLEAEDAARVEAHSAERARLEAEEQARAETKAAAAAAEQARLETEERARAEAAAEERAQVEAEERARLQAAEQARAEAEAELEAEAAERARLEAEEQARAEAEEAARLEAEAAAAEQSRLEAEAAERARLEAEEQARAEAEEAARLEAEAAERARLEAEEQARAEAEAAAAEQARLEAEERARAEAEEAARLEAEERARAEAEDAARLEAEAAAAEQARLEAEERERADAEEAARLADEAARREQEEAAAAALAAAPDPVEELELGEATLEEQKESRGDARRRRREEKEAEKRRAEEERQRAKEAEEQRKRDEKAAKEEAKRREVEEKEAAKRREIEAKETARREAEEAKRREAEEKEAAKRREIEAKEAAKREAEEARIQAKLDAEQRKREEIAAREAEKARARQAEEDERRRQAEEKHRAEEERRRLRAVEKARRGGGLVRRRGKEERHDEFDMDADESPVEPIPDIVERLRFYSREPAGTPPHASEEAEAEDRTAPSTTNDAD
jgi:acetyl-CoA synthetase/medium-chain acyl-CoA synthetase